MGPPKTGKRWATGKRPSWQSGHKPLGKQHFRRSGANSGDMMTVIGDGRAVRPRSLPTSTGTGI